MDVIKTQAPRKECVTEIIFLISQPNTCCGYSKEPSQRDGSFEHPKYMFKLMDKKIIAILRKKLLNWPNETTYKRQEN